MKFALNEVIKVLLWVSLIIKCSIPWKTWRLIQVRRNDLHLQKLLGVDGCIVEFSIIFHMENAASLNEP